MARGKLTLKQERFVAEYLKDLNATQAAIRAGYSERSAASIGDENLRKPEVAAAVENAMAKRAERTALTQEEVIDGLRDEATDHTDQSSHAARVKAWELLGRHLGMFPTEVKHKHGGDPDNPTPIPISSADGRRKELEDAKQELAEMTERLRQRATVVSPN